MCRRVEERAKGNGEYDEDRCEDEFENVGSSEVIVAAAIVFIEPPVLFKYNRYNKSDNFSNEGLK